MITHTIQSDTDLSSILGFEVLPVNLDSSGMCQQDVMSDDPRLSAAITNSISLSIAGMARGKHADIVAEDGTAVWFVECDPVLDLGEGLEHDSGVVGIISNEVLLVQETSISFVEFIRQIPVEESDERDDAGGEKIIDHFDVKLEASLVDRVITTSQRDDA